MRGDVIANETVSTVGFSENQIVYYKKQMMQINIYFKKKIVRIEKRTVKETVWILISGILGVDGVIKTGEANFCSVTSIKRKEKNV